MTGGRPISAEIVLKGEVSVRSGVLGAASIAVRAGTVRLGGAESETGPETGAGLATTAGNITFHENSSLVVAAGLGLVTLPRRGACLTFFPGATLDVGSRSLSVLAGRLLLHGTLRIGGMDEEDPFLLNYVSVDQGTGRAAIGEGFRVEIAEPYLLACRKAPECTVSLAVVVDAVVTRITGEREGYWDQVIETKAGRFRASARLGVMPDKGGGLRLSYIG